MYYVVYPSGNADRNPERLSYLEFPSVRPSRGTCSTRLALTVHVDKPRRFSLTPTQSTRPVAERRYRTASTPILTSRLEGGDSRNAQQQERSRTAEGADGRAAQRSSAQARKKPLFLAGAACGARSSVRVRVCPVRIVSSGLPCLGAGARRRNDAVVYKVRAMHSHGAIGASPPPPPRKQRAPDVQGK